MLSESQDKTIVLTGDMVPLSAPVLKCRKGGALFNLGSAFSAVELLKLGVYIVMNATVFSWDNVRKNKELGRIEKKGETFRSYIVNKILIILQFNYFIKINN